MVLTPEFGFLLVKNLKSLFIGFVCFISCYIAGGDKGAADVDAVPREGARAAQGKRPHRGLRHREHAGMEYSVTLARFRFYQ